MNRLIDLVQPFDKYESWTSIINENFERKSGTYSYVTVSDLELRYDDNVYKFPKKITFRSGYQSRVKNIILRETSLLNEKKIEIIETKKTIPFGRYERTGKYSGDLFEIIGDLLESEQVSQECMFSDLLTTNNNPLYSIDSKQKWASYMLILKKQEEVRTDISVPTILNDLLDDFGIHYNYDTSLENYVILIFPMPYLKVVENKIRRNGIEESIFLVFELNRTSLLFTSNIKIEIDGVIRNTKNEIIYQHSREVKFDNSTFQTVTLLPDKKEEIGFSEFVIKINGVIVEKISGFYIRNINININPTSNG